MIWNKLFFYLSICLTLIIYGCKAQNTYAETAHIYHINPAYKQLAEKRPVFPSLHRKAFRNATVDLSYTSFVESMGDYLQNHTPSFQITLQYGFLFADVNDIINQAMAEVFDGDDYLAQSYVNYHSSWSGYDGNVIIDFFFDFLTTANEEEEITQRLQEIMFGYDGIIMPGMNHEEMEKEIHDWIALNVAYDLSLTEYSAYAALFLGTAVCQGYSLLMTRMLWEVDIESKIVVSEAMNHAWNMVNLCDKWYHIDVTWDDPVPDTPNYVRYNYYNLSDSEIGQDHTLPGGYPICPYSYVEGDCGSSSAQEINSDTTTVLTGSSPNAIVYSGHNVVIYGNFDDNEILIESGAQVKLINFPGNNKITLPLDFGDFSIYRRGATVLFDGIDGTMLSMPSTMEIQTVHFVDQSLRLRIEHGNVMLGTQIVDTVIP